MDSEIYNPNTTKSVQRQKTKFRMVNSNPNDDVLAAGVFSQLVTARCGQFGTCWVAGRQDFKSIFVSLFFVLAKGPLMAW